MKTQTDALLIKLICPGDMLELFNGNVNEAVSQVGERFGVCYYHAKVSVRADGFFIPVDTCAINAVWRNGVCIWRRGESLVQKDMFEGVFA